MAASTFDVSTLSDVDLVFAFIGMLSAADPDLGGGPMFGGQTRDGAQLTREFFYEIAKRWLPNDVVADAFDQLYPDGDDA